MRCWAQPPNSTSPALSKNALSHVRKSKRAAEADWKLVLQWGRSLNREGCTSALSFHPDLGAFGLVSTRVLPQGVKEARLAAAMKRYRTGGHSCNVVPCPGFIWHHTDQLLSEQLCTCGMNAHLAQATNAPWVFVPSGHLFLYMHFKNSSPRLPWKLIREPVN